VPAGFNEDNPDLADLFANILPRGVAPVHPKTMGPAAGLIVPPYNEIQTWEARIRLPAEATLLPFSNEIVYVVVVAPKVRVPSTITDRLGESTRTLAISGIASGTVFTPPIVGTSTGTLAITGASAGIVFTPTGSTATLVITGTAAGTVRVLGASSQALAITGTATGGVPSAYSYVRIGGIDIGGDIYLDLNELQFATAADAGSVISGIAAGASAATGPATDVAVGTPANINDDSTGTRVAWTETTAEGGSFYLTINLNTPRVITHWRQNYGGADNRYIRGATFEVSNNGTTWTVAKVATGITNPGVDTWSAWYSFT
jgi:hypothetical protein